MTWLTVFSTLVYYKKDSTATLYNTQKTNSLFSSLLPGHTICYTPKLRTRALKEEALEYSKLYAQEVERRRENLFSVCSTELQWSPFYSGLDERKLSTKP